jgi:hypothetical protein
MEMTMNNIPTFAADYTKVRSAGRSKHLTDKTERRLWRNLVLTPGQLKPAFSNPLIGFHRVKKRRGGIFIIRGGPSILTSLQPKLRWILVSFQAAIFSDSVLVS